jgi:hypothetical protein
VIPNVTKGQGTVGLLRYLVGPGRAEEHVLPHVVGGSDLLVAGYGQEESLTARQATEIAAWIDTPRRAHGTEVTVPVKQVDPTTGDATVVGRKEQHVWHCSLSLAAGEAPIGDERWGRIATEFAEAMGFTDASGKPACRWVAIHHGPSKNGNDHIHIAASMVREDGTVWDGRYLDYDRTQKACRVLEARHGLVVVEGPERGITERGVKPGEAARAAAAGAQLSRPQDMALRIRAAAVASTSEAEFVRRVRAEGIVIKPRYGPGSTSEVVGYKVAVPPAEGQGWQFYGGGRLARDLSLPKLRESWTGPGQEATGAAVAEWRAAHTGAAVAESAGRETGVPVAGAERIAAERWREFNQALEVLPHDAAAGWAAAARQTSAALTAWRDPQTAHTARTLARGAAAGTSGAGPGTTVAGVLLARTGRGGAATTDLGRELARSVELIRAHHGSVGAHTEADRLTGAPTLAAVAAPARAAGLVRSATRAAERIVDHGR